MPSLPHQPVHPVFAGKELEWDISPVQPKWQTQPPAISQFPPPPRTQTYRNPLPSETDHLGNIPRTATEEADQAIFNAVPAQRNRQ